MALVHIVLMPLKPEATEDQTRALLTGAQAMVAEIPAIGSFSMGTQLASVDDGRNCGAGLVATFASDADYKVYASHDVHMRFIANEIQPIAAGRNALQFRLSGSIDAHTRAADEPPCILHAVLLTLNPETTDEQKTAILEGLAALPSTIPEIRSYSVGTQAAEVDDGRNVTLGLVSTFKSESDYQTYASHPEHIAVIKGLILPVIAPGGRAAMQMEF